MAPRSKVTGLPDDKRQELEQRLIASGFAGYEELADWLNSQGYQISKSSLHRWGSNFEEKCATLKIATDQAKAIVAGSPDDEGAMGEALTRLVQEKLFNVLLDLEVDPETIELPKLTRAIADLGRASINQKKHAALVRQAAREELLAEQAKAIDSVAKSEGLSAETANIIRRQILGLS